MVTSLKQDVSASQVMTAFLVVPVLSCINLPLIQFAYGQYWCWDVESKCPIMGGPSVNLRYLVEAHPIGPQLLCDIHEMFKLQRFDKITIDPQVVADSDVLMLS